MPPNVLLIHTDQQRWDALGAAGNDEIHTPNLDRLAEEGVRFDRYFVQAPVCMPSRESYLTGQYPSQLDIYTNGVPLPEDVETVAGMLGTHGFTTANLGKLHFLPHANRDHRETHPSYGFDHLEISDEPGVYRDAYRAWIERRDPDALDDISVGLPPATDAWYDWLGETDVEHPDPRFPKEPVPFPADPELTHTAYVADRTRAFLDDHRDDRFFCVAGFYSPHSPWVVPQEYLDLYDPVSLSIPDFPPELEDERERLAAAASAAPDEATYSDEELRGARHGYYAMVSEVDHHVGWLLDHLESLGIREETVVVFTSDHGEFLGEHLNYGKGWPAPDCVSRVPLIVAGPGIEAGVTREEIVEAVDLVPTLCSIAERQTPPQCQGRSLLPLLEGRSESGDRQGDAIVECSAGKVLRTDRYRYTIAADGEERLHDLEAEFGEYRDVSTEPTYRDDLERIRGRLLERLVAHDVDTERPRTWPY